MAKELPEIMTCVQCRKQGYEEMCIVGAIKPLTKVQADEIIRRCKAEPKLRKLLRYAFELPSNEAGNYEENVKWQEDVEQALSEEKPNG